MKICMISNGYGEDTIGCNIATALREENEHCQITAYPLVGTGHGYAKADLAIGLKNKVMPSGGFIRTFRDLRADIRAGLLGQIRRQKRLLNHAQRSVDATIIVGDTYALWMGRSSHKKPTFFLPTAKSERFMSHSLLECRLMKTTCVKIYPRDNETHRALCKKGLPSEYLGNPMMDKLHPSKAFQAPDPQRPIITVLPGSRDEAIENLELCLSALDALRAMKGNFRILIAKAPSLDSQDINEKINKFAPLNSLISTSDQFVDAVAEATLVLGLAGTANEQAMFMNKPVVAFPGTGPQSTRKRFLEQQKLMQGTLQFVDSQDPQQLANVILETLSTHKPKALPKPQFSANAIAKSILGALQSHA